MRVIKGAWKPEVLGESVREGGKTDDRLSLRVLGDCLSGLGSELEAGTHCKGILNLILSLLSQSMDYIR